ncbi:hypothetical protein EZV73_18035 [Acidaminobacter sp. JC074]|uniref:zf-HC2 domain-containing protein n=1 Tax=Acidaminobacter sp. JC074 TaxID=2530199 RepID=UPI001F0F2157|nr:zf-HC2 domain-containing protein [Acidaminobacter sp. JC074]MCH4889486.1 hypothetical protein [Acidaminobacter sp. JC074]
MKYKCDLIKDLIPLYIDRCASSESNRVIESHLKECPTCREYYASMSESDFSDMTEKEELLSYGKRIKRRRFKIVLIIVVAMVLQAGLIIGGMTSMMAVGSVYDTNDPNEYRQFNKHFEGEVKERFSHLLVFPESVDGSSVKAYRYYASEKGLDNEYLVYLDLTLAEDEYLNEIDRIRNLETEYKENRNKILIKEIDGYKAYIAVYDHNGCYEYVLVDEAHHRLIYVYSQFKGADAYLNDNDLWIGSEMDLDESNALSEKKGYSIYYFKTGSNQLYMINSQQLD